MFKNTQNENLNIYLNRKNAFDHAQENYNNLTQQIKELNKFYIEKV